MKTVRKPQIYIISAFLMVFWGCSTPQTTKTAQGELFKVDSTTVAEVDHEVDSIISIYQSSMQEEMSRVLVHSAMAMQKGTPEGLLNNFVADLVLEQGQELYQPDDEQPIDFCLLNYGGLRTSLPEGPIQLSRVFELMPFENEMVVVTLTPDKTWDLFEYLAASDVGMPVSGITLGIQDNKLADVRIQGERFDETRNYKIITSDYLAGGGDNMNFFLNPIEIEVLGRKIRDAIILHMQRQDQNGNMIRSQLDNRIYIIE
ncbi:MAG: 5'-nucleotidase [Bacteroidales bacterium]